MLYFFHVKYIQNLLQMIYANGTRLCRRSGAGSPSIRARHISVGARWGGGAEGAEDTTGECQGPPKNEREKKKKKKGLKNLSEERGKCINDLVAAGLTGLHGHGWRMVTVLPHAPNIVVSTPHCACGNPSSILGLDTMLRKASAARVNRRLRRYYLIVRLLPNVFALACRSLGSIYYDTGSPHDGKTPFGWLHPCRLVTDSRRYLIVGAPATMPLYSSFIFSLNNRASTIS